MNLDIKKFKKFHKKTPKLIIDIGANVGQFYRECKTHFPFAKIYSIEASSDAYEKLKKININSYNLTLFSCEKDVNFYTSKNIPSCTGNSIFREKTSYYDEENVDVEIKRATTLDKSPIAKVLSEKIIDLIKIDTQGSELEIMKGGELLIKRTRYLLIEVSIEKYNDGSPLALEIIRYLHGLGFLHVDVMGVGFHPETGLPIQYDYLFRNSYYFKNNNIFNYLEKIRKRIIFIILSALKV